MFPEDADEMAKIVHPDDGAVLSGCTLRYISPNTVKHLISAVSNFRGSMKMTHDTFKFWHLCYIMAPDSKENLM